MLKHQALQLIDRITYKPGWAIELEFCDDQVQLIITTAPTPDATNPECMLEDGLTTMQVGAIEMMGEREFLNWVENTINVLEIHEAREWFKLDGKPVIPQH